MCTTCKLLHIICKSPIHVHHLIIIVSWRRSVDAPASRSSSLGSLPHADSRENQKIQHIECAINDPGSDFWNERVKSDNFTVVVHYICKWSVVFRYGIHLWDIGHTSMWEGRSTWCYNTDLMMDLAMYTVDFAHHLHMLVRNSWLKSE